MRKKIYLVFDEVDNKSMSYFEAPTFGHVVRNNWRLFQKVNPYFDEDWSVYEIGDINEHGFPVFYDESKYVPLSWNEFLNPEIQAQRMSVVDQEKLRSQPSGILGNPPPEVR